MKLEKDISCSVTNNTDSNNDNIERENNSRSTLAVTNHKFCAIEENLLLFVVVVV